VAKLPISNGIYPGLIATIAPVNPTTTVLYLFIPTFSDKKIEENIVTTKGEIKVNVSAFESEM
jgi:hypothetical protein